jgi:hypothetical protein
MLMCKGHGCHWRDVCSRYVLRKAVQAVDVSAKVIDHCLHATKFVRCSGAKTEDDKE